MVPPAIHIHGMAYVAGTDTRVAGALVERVCQARDAATVRALIEQ